MPSGWTCMICGTCGWSPNASRAAPSLAPKAGVRISATTFPTPTPRGACIRSCASSPRACALKAKLKVCRGAPGEAGRYERYEVPFEAGQTVLDALRWIRVHHDASLAIRFSCINANACKQCMIQVDGKTVYACTTRLAEKEMMLRSEEHTSELQSQSNLVCRLLLEKKK